MFAGKTSRLISLAKAHRIAGKRVKLFKPERDNRYEVSNISTHDGLTIGCSVVEDSNFYETLGGFNPDVVCIDETQFFEEHKLKQFIVQMLYAEKKEVIVAGLSQDSDGRPFGAMPHLLAIADDIIHLKAVCSASNEIGIATRTYRKDKTNDSQVLVGGKDLYEARCFKEWINE